MQKNDLFRLEKKINVSTIPSLRDLKIFSPQNPFFYCKFYVEIQM